MNSTQIKKLNELPGWLSIHEGQFLQKAARMVRNRKGCIVEIGSFQGKSTVYLAKTGQHIFAIDPHEGKLDHGTKFSPTLKAFKKNINDFQVANRVSLIQKTSFEASKHWKDKIKLLFIDGLHDEKNAKLDYDAWSTFVNNGGVVAMHDSFCGWEGAQRVAWENIILNNQYFEVGVVGSIVYGIKGSGNLFTVLNKIRIRLLIKIAFWLNNQKSIPKELTFFFIHRVIKLLLINRFTVHRK